MSRALPKPLVRADLRAAADARKHERLRLARRALSKGVPAAVVQDVFEISRSDVTRFERAEWKGAV